MNCRVPIRRASGARQFKSLRAIASRRYALCESHTRLSATMAVSTGHHARALPSAFSSRYPPIQTCLFLLDVLQIFIHGEARAMGLVQAARWGSTRRRPAPEGATTGTATKTATRRCVAGRSTGSRARRCFRTGRSWAIRRSCGAGRRRTTRCKFAGRRPGCCAKAGRSTVRRSRASRFLRRRANRGLARGCAPRAAGAA